MLRNYIIKAVFIIYFSIPFITFGLNSKRMILPLNQSRPELPFDSLLNDIYTQIKGDWDPPVKLYSTRNFEYMYQNSSRYYMDIKRVLSDSLYMENKKMICVYMSQKLDFHKYLEFSNYCLELFNAGLITEDILYNIIVPYEWKTHTRFVERYKDKEVSHFLKLVLNSDKLSALCKKAVNEIAKGKTFRIWQKMLRES